GPSRARNAGAAVARGSWIVFLDDDDTASEQWLRSLVSRMTSDRVALVSCGATELDPSGTFVGTAQPGSRGPAFGVVIAHFRSGCFCVRRSIFDAVGGYDPEMGFGEAFELGIRICAHIGDHDLEAAVVPEPLVNWTIHPPEDRTIAQPAVLLAAA